MCQENIRQRPAFGFEHGENFGSAIGRIEDHGLMGISVAYDITVSLTMPSVSICVFIAMSHSHITYDKDTYPNLPCAIKGDSNSIEVRLRFVPIRLPVRIYPNLANAITGDQETNDVHLRYAPRVCPVQS